MQEEFQKEEFQKEEFQKEDDLRYRSRVFCSRTMGHDDPKDEKYYCNAKMIEEDAALKMYPCIEYKPEYSMGHWMEAVPSIYIGRIPILNDEIKGLDVTEDGVRLIAYLFPPNQSLYFYDVRSRSSDYEYDRVARNFTFGYSKDEWISLNPFSTVAVFDLSPIFFMEKVWRTMGISGPFQRLKSIQDRFLCYADKLMKPIFGAFDAFENAEVAKFMHVIALLLGKEVETGLEYSTDLTDDVFAKLKGSGTVKLYGGDKAIESKYYDDFLKGTILYYMDVFDYVEVTEAIIEKVIVPSVGKIDAITAKKIKLAVYIVWVVNELNSRFNDFLNYMIDEKTVLSRQFLRDGKMDTRSDYYKYKGRLDEAFRSAKEVFISALKFYRLAELGTQNKRTHRYAKLSEKPHIGNVYSFVESEPADIQIGDFEGVFGSNKYTPTRKNNISGKSIVFTIPSTSRATDVRIFLLGAEGITYDSDSCLIQFTRVMASIGGKTIVFSASEENAPYYICHYIHSSKDDDKETYSAVRLEFGPELNVPTSSTLKDANNNGIILNDVDKRFNLLCSSIYYIPVKFFRTYSFKCSPIQKDGNSLLATVDECNLVMKVTTDLGIRLQSNTGNSDGKEFVDVGDRNKSLMADDIFGLTFGDLEKSQYNTEEVVGVLQASKASRPSDLYKPKSVDKKIKKVNFEDVLEGATIGNVILNSDAVEELKKALKKELKKDKK